MARVLADIEREIRSLAVGDQEHLLRALLEELDGPPDKDVERAWIAEAARRSAELDAGTVAPISAAEVFSTARASLKK
jgi:Putative addiction module component